MLLSLEVIRGELGIGGFERSKTCLFFLLLELPTALEEELPTQPMFCSKGIHH